MKHVSLSIFLTILICASYPSIKANKNNENFHDYEYEICAMSDGSNEAYAINSGALSPVSSPYNKRLYLGHYYSGLSNNYPANQKGSCTFVALSMLLSYYDSYLDDNIIPEQCDVASTGNGNDIIARKDSPGTLHDFIPYEEVGNYYPNKGMSDLTNKQYYHILESKYGDTSFQFKLAKLASENGYFDLKNDNRKSFGLGVNVYEVLKLYLSTVGYEEGVDYELSFIYKEDGYDDDIKNFIIKHINAGNPVYTSGAQIKDNDVNGHAYVCYDYDDTETIFAHYGWTSYHAHTNAFERFKDIVRCFAINFKREHTHSYNYMVVDKAYCYCDKAIETYHNHSYGNPVKLDKQYHISCCNCGETRKGVHWVKGTTCGRYANCAACGAQIDLWTDVIIGTMSLNKTANGSYISKRGIPVIAEPDVEAYLNGTLKFGSGISNYDYI